MAGTQGQGIHIVASAAELSGAKQEDDAGNSELCCRVHLQPPTYLPTMGGTLNQTDVQPAAADQPKPVCRACNGTIVLLTTSMQQYAVLRSGQQ